MCLNVEDTTKIYPGPSCKKSVSWQKRKKRIAKSLTNTQLETCQYSTYKNLTREIFFLLPSVVENIFTNFGFKYGT
jgi:hypothetical protein